MTLGRKAAVLLAGCAGIASIGLNAAPAMAEDLVGLITKTQVSFFIAMQEGAEARAEELGLDLQTFSGRDHGDSESQISAIESLISAGAKGIAIVPTDPIALAPAIQRARDAGILVIALDTPFDPIDAADATFATDNRLAGKLIGQWANAQLGEEAANASIAMLDFSAEQVTVDYLRDQGFLEGFGIDVGDPNRWGDENDPRICGHFMTGAVEAGARTGMEQALQKCPDINVVYTINEPTAAGAYEALRAVGKDDGSVLLVSIDGGCDGVRNVQDGVIDATSMQFPRVMAAMAMDAIDAYIKTGEIPEVTPGLGFTDTGTRLVTNTPVDGIESMDSAAGLELCWG